MAEDIELDVALENLQQLGFASPDGYRWRMTGDQRYEMENILASENFSSRRCNQLLQRCSKRVRKKNEYSCCKLQRAMYW